MAVPVSTKNYYGKAILVERLMQELGIQAIAKRKYKRTTDSGHSKKVAENHLNRRFTPERPNTSWVADITYIYTKEGCGYTWQPSWISIPVKSSAGP